MGAIPTSPRNAVFTWAQAHIQPWTTNASQIGLTTKFAGDFAASVLNYQQTAADTEAAKQAYEVAVRNSTVAFTAMRRNMSAGISTIRTFALQQTDPNVVYALSAVPPRANPSSLPAPGRPFELTVELLQNTGAVQLRWKSVNPVGTSGTSYIITRKLPGETNFTFVGVTGERRFVDNTFVAGPDSVQYIVKGQRADKAGEESSIFTINFGVAGPGRQAVVTGTSETENALAESAKLAA